MMLQYNITTFKFAMFVLKIFKNEKSTVRTRVLFLQEIHSDGLSK